MGHVSATNLTEAGGVRPVADHGRLARGASDHGRGGWWNPLGEQRDTVPLPAGMQGGYQGGGTPGFQSLIKQDPAQKVSTSLLHSSDHVAPWMILCVVEPLILGRGDGRV